MVFSASNFRQLIRRIPLLATAGIAAVLTGLPTLAWASPLRPPELSNRGQAAVEALASRDLRLFATDFHADFVERASADFAFDLAGRLPSLDDLLRNRFRDAYQDGGFFDAAAHRIAAALALRHFCRLGPPPVVIPEPGTALLLAGGLIALACVKRKRSL